MNQILQTTGINTGFPSSAICGGEKVQEKCPVKNYDTVTLHPDNAPSSDLSFVSMLTKRISGEITDESIRGTSPEKLARLRREISEDTYTPNAVLIAKRLLGY